jgi:hypothetical protein
MLKDAPIPTSNEGKPSYKHLTVRRASDGVFKIDSSRVVGWVGWFFPIPSPLGWHLYKDYEAMIVATAPEYCTLYFMYKPQHFPDAQKTYYVNGQREGNKDSEASDLARCMLEEKGILNFYLKKKKR